MTSGWTSGAVSLFIVGITGCLKPAARVETPGTASASQRPLTDGAPQSPHVPASALTTRPEPVGVAIPETEYPYEALTARFEGSVALQILIDETGRVREAKLVKDPGHGLGDAAVRSAIAHFRFLPARRAGRPIAAWVPIVVRYELPLPRPEPAAPTATPIRDDEKCGCASRVNAIVQDGLDRGLLTDPYCIGHR